MYKLLIISLIIIFIIFFIYFNKYYKYKKITYIALIIILLSSLLLININSNYSRDNTPNKNKSTEEIYSKSTNDISSRNLNNKDEIRKVISNTVKKNLGENYNYTLDLIENRNNTYTVSLFLDDTGYDENQCVRFLNNLSSKLKLSQSISRMEVFFTKDLLIKYTLSIENFQKNIDDITIKKDSY